MASHPLWTRDLAYADGDRSLSAMPEILYVMGTGRSGTTILEVLLTNDSGISGTGELKHIFRDGFVRDLQCACGSTGHQCELWSRVLQRSEWTQEECRQFGAIIDQTEAHANFPAVYLGLTGKRTLDRYKQAGATLFSAVASLAGTGVIVDSSKYPARALLLDRLFPGRVKVLCITRSASGLIAAFQKQNDGEQKPKSRVAVALYFLYVLACMRLVRSRLRERCLAIRFEDLNRDPVGVLAAIERWSGHSFATARAKIAAGEEFKVGHIMTGNRLRKKGRVKFDPAAGKVGAPKAAERSGVLASLLEIYRKLLRF